MATGEKATPAPKPGAKGGKAAKDAAITEAMAGQAAAKRSKKESQNGNTVAAAPTQPVDRSAAALARAAESPCEAAAGPKSKPRPCSGVGVVSRKPTNARRNIKICAAHVLAKELRAFKEAAEAAEKEAAKA